MVSRKDHDTDNSKTGATVTPIRPEIQLTDTTPFGDTQTESTSPGAEQDTWGTSPRRRMCAQEATDAPDETTSIQAADRGDERAPTTSTKAAAGNPLVDNANIAGQINNRQSYFRLASLTVSSSWQRARAVTLLAAVLGAAFAALNGVTSTNSQPPPYSHAQSNAQSSLIVPSLHKSLPNLGARTNHHAVRPIRRHQQHRTRVHRSTRHHKSQNTTPSVTSNARGATTSAGTSTTPPGIQTTPVAPAPPAPTQTVASNPTPAHSSSSSNRPIIGQNGTLAPGTSPDS